MNTKQNFFAFFVLCIGILLIFLTLVASFHYIFLIVGAILAIIGGFKFMGRLFQIRSLKNRGIKIDATVEKITLETHPIRPYRYSIYRVFTDVNYYNYRIHCAGINPLTKEMQDFVSDILKEEPSLDLTIVKTIPVYIDNTNSTIYYVDISKISLRGCPKRVEGKYVSTDGITYSLLQ